MTLATILPVPTIAAPRKIIIDTDPGVGIPGTDADDPIALLLAIADPRIELLGVTTVFGNCPPELGARGAKAVLEAVGCDVPVSVGMGTRLTGDLPGRLPMMYAGERGRPGRIELPSLGDSITGMHAADFLIETVHAHPGEVTVVAIGPQTNIALALLKDPSIRDEIASIVFMGGALGIDPRYGRGNVTPVAECNIWYDAPAADLVFRSGIDLTMVSLDVTNPAKGVVLPEETIRRFDPTAAGAEGILSAICETYLDAPMFEWAHGCVLYDPLAMAVAVDPALGRFETMSVGVETGGTYSMGQTVTVRDAEPNLRALVDVDGRAVVGDIVRTILPHLAIEEGAS
ncbi:nucleoside hydrolase [Luethyella okanaganae]|uniref:Nucleoside hydrolase n=1 Tax=Luethyella okanaganae TaxID=69372 RepID=A0ABW1VHA5_9MICO